MRANHKFFENSQGQSSLETALILGTLVVTLFASLRLGLKFILLLSVDDFLESYLLCNAYQQEAFCRSELKLKMVRAHIQLDSIRLIDHPEKTIAHLQVSNGLFETVQRSREYLKRD